MPVEAGDVKYNVGVSGMDSLGSALTKGQKWGMAMTAIGVGTIAALAKGVSEASEFSEGLGNLATLGVGNMKELEAGVKDTAITFGTDLNDAIASTYDVISAGIPEGSAITFLDQAAMAAKAGVGELSDAVDLGTSVMNAFGKSAGDVNSIFDEAQAAIRAGKTNMSELGSAVGKVAPLFKAAGLESTEMFGSIAQLTKGGIQTAEAVTGLKAILTNIIKPSKEASEAASALGIEFGAAALESKGLAGFLNDVTNKVKENGPAIAAQASAMEKQLDAYDSLNSSQKEQIAGLKQHKLTLEAQRDAMKAMGKSTKDLDNKIKAAAGQLKGFGAVAGVNREEISKLKKEYKSLEGISDNTLATMSKLFGSVEALNSVLALTGDGGAGLAETLDLVENSAGMVQESFDAFVANNPAFAFDQLKQSVKVLWVEIGQALLPVLSTMAETIFPIIKGMAEWAGEHPKLTTGLVATAGALGTVMAILGPLLLILPGLTTGVGMLAGTAGAVGAGAGFAGLAATIGAAALAAVPFIAIAIALGAAVAIVGVSVAQTNAALAEQIATEQALTATTDLYIKKIQEKTGWVSQDMLQQMEHAEQMRFLADREKREVDIMALAWLEFYQGREATQEEFGRARNLMLNEEISAQEAAIAVSMDLTDEQRDHLMRSFGDETKALLEEFGIREQASRATDKIITLSNYEAAANRRALFLQSADEITERERQLAAETSGFWRDTWESIKALFGFGGNIGGTFRQAGVEARAAGGPVSAGGSYIVGEQGPERFTPSQDGFITPNPGGGGSRGQSISIINNFNVQPGMDINVLSEQVGATIQRKLRAAGAAA